MCLAVLVLVLSKSTFADSFVCVPERANGFVYDQETKTWQVSSFSVENKSYLVSPADENNIFIKALKYDYEIKDVSSPKPIIHCKAVKETDSNLETGLILCRGSLGASFNIDKASGRYVRSQPSGYVAKKASTETGDGPYMEIGNCSPK
jgi:hypothetical protein